MTALVAATLFGTTTVVVAPGDTLSEIAADHDVTIAEFVEDRNVLDILKRIGVDYAQGYEIGRPQPLNEI